MICGKFSRLYIDLNRGIEDPTLIPQISEKKIIAGNVDISNKEISKRHKYYQSYHTSIKSCLLENKINIIISLHSFNPTFKNQKRSIMFGVLSNSDYRLSKELLYQFKKRNIKAGDNEPYSGNLYNDTLYKHGLKNKLHHSLIEVRNDLLTNKKKIKKVSILLKEIILSSIGKINKKDLINL
tara:strand:+ start:538 stop:1083 length:546 start_codon:yes stop_codon:yes gene_type:complete